MSAKGAWNTLLATILGALLQKVVALLDCCWTAPHCWRVGRTWGSEGQNRQGRGVRQGEKAVCVWAKSGGNGMHWILSPSFKPLHSLYLLGCAETKWLAHC